MTGKSNRQQAPLSFALALASSLLVVSGCSPPPRTVEVVGRVTHNGVPVEGAVVVFFGEKHADDLPAAGRTDATGRYELRTYFAASDIALGAVPNDYAVSVFKYKRPDIYGAQKKMREIAEAGGDVRRYIAEKAIHDLWPGGVPEGWPLGYVPCVNLPPMSVLNNEKLAEKLARIVNGIPLLPTSYADPTTSGLRAPVEQSDGPLTFDFDLTGEIDESTPPPNSFWSGPAG